MKNRPWDVEGLRFKRYLGPILDALRTLGGSATPREVLHQVTRDLNLPEEALTGVRRSGVPRLANQLSWARLYLRIEGLVDTSRRGVWTLTDTGRTTHLALSDALALVSHWDKVFGAKGQSRSRTGSAPAEDQHKRARAPIILDESTPRESHESRIDRGIGDAAWLVARGFIPIGSWSLAAPKLQRQVQLRRVRGVYAFVVNDRIHYIGKATNVRRRLRLYNRGLLPKASRPQRLPFRLVHEKIGETVNAGGTVDAWIHEHGAGSSDTIEALEARWIKEKQPRWNIVGVPRVP